jgi:Right handed beta helix region
MFQFNLQDLRIQRMEEKMSFENFNVLDYGADPLGKADSYQAFQDWAQAITAKGGGVGLVPPGIYKIDQVLDWDGGDIYNSDIRNFVFDQCNGLHLVGFGATINLKGDDIRKTQEHHLTLENGTIFYYSYLRMVGFVIQNCDNVCIEGFDINGNANLVKQDSDDDHSFVEGGDDILSICGSRNVTIRNMRIHHAWTDGISVRRTYPVAPSTMGIGCQQVVIENCEVYANARCNIAGHEFRHMRIADCRLHHGGLTGGVLTYSPACNIDIEPDPVMTDLSPADWSAETGTPSGLRFVILENCEFVDSKGVNVVINVRFSHFVVRSCFFNNSSNSDFPCIFSVPHCSIQESEIDTNNGRIDVALTGTQPGGNVFTMERCLIRASSGQGLAIIPQQGFIAQALIANCRFICEATSPTDTSFPVVETGLDMLMLTFRDNYTFIPSASYSKEEPQKTVGFKVCSTVAASLAENNVWETDYAGDDTHYLGVYYHIDFSEYPKYPILVRNERFISPNNKGIIPFDATDHDNNFPFSGGISAIGDEINLGRQRIKYGGASAPTSGSFHQGDLIFNNNVKEGESLGWVCVVKGTAGVDAEFRAMPPVGV